MTIHGVALPGCPHLSLMQGAAPAGKGATCTYFGVQGRIDTGERPLRMEEMACAPGSCRDGLFCVRLEQNAGPCFCSSALVLSLDTPPSRPAAWAPVSTATKEATPDSILSIDSHASLD